MQAADRHHVGDPGRLIQGLDLLIHALFLAKKHGLHHGSVFGRKQKLQGASHSAFYLPEQLTEAGIVLSRAGDCGVTQFKGIALPVIICFRVKFARIGGFPEMTDLSAAADQASDFGKIRIF